MSRALFDRWTCDRLRFLIGWCRDESVWGES